MRTPTDIFAEDFGAHAIPAGEVAVPMEQAELDELRADILDAVPKAELLGQLALAEAPLTGRKVACVLKTSLRHETWGYLYGGSNHRAGHSVERGQGNTTTALSMALGAFEHDTETITSIYITGINIPKAKYLMPSCTDYDLLCERGIEEVDITLIKPDTFDDVYIVNPEDHVPAYRHRHSNNFSGDAWTDREEDPVPRLGRYELRLLDRLNLTARCTGIAFYLMGSAAEKGPSFAMKGNYDDLDIIALSDRSREEVYEFFQKEAETIFGTLERIAKSNIYSEEGKPIDGVIFANERIAIDFFAGSTLEEIVVRPENVPRNFLVRFA